MTFLHYKDNNSNCVNDNIAKVLEVYDEETCLETMRGELALMMTNLNGSLQDIMSRLLIRSCRMNVGVLCLAVSLTIPPTLTDSRYYLQLSDI